MNHFLHLLLADDDEDDRELFQIALENLSLNVQFTTVEDGEELMRWLYQQQDKLPDLLFLDLNMPFKSGLECLIEIKQDQKLQSLPVIILSSGLNAREMEGLFTTGAQFYIQKPDSLKKLTQLIGRILSLSEEEKQSQPAKDNFILYRH